MVSRRDEGTAAVLKRLDAVEAAESGYSAAVRSISMVRPRSAIRMRGSSWWSSPISNVHSVNATSMRRTRRSSASSSRPQDQICLPPSATRNLHPQRSAAAEAAECAHEQGKLWEMHDGCSRTRMALSRADFLENSCSIGLDERWFESCLNDDAQARSKMQVRSGATWHELDPVFSHRHRRGRGRCECWSR